MTTRQKRDLALSDLASVIQELWGARCTMHEAGCHCCAAWVMFDAMVRLTDASGFADEQVVRRKFPRKAEGGHARMVAMSAQERSEFAKKGAAARWAHKNGGVE